VCRVGCVCKGRTVKERFEFFKPQLQAMSDGDAKIREDILKSAHPCLIRLICEVILNILKGDIELKGHQYEELRPYKQMFLKICEDGVTLKRRRNILVRKVGGFLPKILPGLLSAISGFAGHSLANLVL
jgi:hypothetical protein